MSHNSSSSQELEITEVEQASVAADHKKNATWIIVFCVFGIALLSPWNIWIQQTEYFSFRLKGSIFAGSFEGWISVVFQIFNILTLMYFLNFPNKFTVEQRIKWGLRCSIAVFSVAAILPVFDALDPNSYFVVILFLVGLSSFVSGMLAAMIGICSGYPSSSMTSMNSGQGIAGLLPSVAQLLLKSNGSDKLPTIIYFSLGVVFSGSALMANYILYLPAFKNESQYVRIQESEHLEIEEDEENEEFDSAKIFYEIRYSCIAVFMTLFITLSVFPAITAGVQSVENTQKFVLYHFFVYSVADFLGKSSTLFYRLSMEAVVALVFLRILFIPLILACNVVLYDRFGNVQDSIFPLIFGDGFFFSIMFIFGFSNGFLTTTAFIACPFSIRSATTKSLAYSGDLMQLFLTLGLTFGSLFTFLLQAMSCRCNPFI